MRILPTLFSPSFDKNILDELFGAAFRVFSEFFGINWDLGPYLGPWLILIGVVAIHAPLWALNAFLVGFHCLLFVRGVTTYTYLTGKEAHPVTSPETELYGRPYMGP